MLKTLYELFKALLNATLILLALCLFWGWKLFSAVEGATENLGQISAGISSLGGEAQSLRDDLTAARATLANLRENGTAATLAPEVTVSLNRLSDAIEGLQGKITDLSDQPGEILSKAAEAGASRFATEISTVASGALSCIPKLTDVSPKAE